MAQTGFGVLRVQIPNATYTPPTTGATGTGFAAGGNYTSIFALRTRLAALNGTYYTAAKLNEMTANDMIFALRNMDDPKSIADYMTASSA